MELLHNWGHTKLGSMYMHCSVFDLISNGNKKNIMLWSDNQGNDDYPMLNYDAVAEEDRHEEKEENIYDRQRTDTTGSHSFWRNIFILNAPFRFHKIFIQHLKLRWKCEDLKKFLVKTQCGNENKKNAPTSKRMSPFFVLKGWLGA